MEFVKIISGVKLERNQKLYFEDDKLKQLYVFQQENLLFV